MSVEVAWDTFTAGPDGAALADKIRDFIHTKFQTIALPRFIKAVHVHTFEFGSVPPQIEIKDICDPLPDFYEDEDETEDENDHDDDDDDDDSHDLPDGSDIDVRDNRLHIEHHNHDTLSSNPRVSAESFSSVRDLANRGLLNHGSFPPPGTSQYGRQGILPSFAALKLHSERDGLADTYNSTFARNATPGIPGGTSNLSYFHLPVGGLSGAQTPLAAVASGTPFSPGPWQHDLQQQMRVGHNTGHESGGQARPSTSDSIPSPEIGSPFDPSSPESRPVTYPTAEKVSDDLTLETSSMPPTSNSHPQSPSDIQVVASVNYDGDVRMTLTAEILLDYPMPSFLGIPVKLSVTGMRFDGVAILAYIKKRMHFCFLDPEDAQTLVGDPVIDQENHTKGKHDVKSNFAGLLREVRVESEIGKKESGKQSLKNVSKVEKFILEQVRRIFEEEFVFPSFWTFLV